MKRKAKVVVFLIILLIVLLIELAFFYEHPSVLEKLDEGYVEFISEEEMQEKGHEQVLEEFRSENSVAFLNSDYSKTVYIYSTPIYYRNKEDNLVMIDTRLKRISNQDEKEYIFEIADNDILSKYPETFTDENYGILVSKDIAYWIHPCCKTKEAVYKIGKNFIGKQRDMLEYEEEGGNTYLFYPSSIGVNCEVLINKKTKNDISFYLQIDQKNPLYPVKKSPDYITLEDEQGNICGVIQKPILKYPNGKTGCDMNYKLDYAEDGKYIITFENSYNIPIGTKAYVSFEQRREKYADNGIYSKLPDLTNNYLSNYVSVGKSERYGIGKLLKRFDFLPELFDYGQKVEIKKAVLYMYDLDPQEGSLFQAKRMKDGWCSIQGNWNSNYREGKVFDEVDACESVMAVDLGKVVEHWIQDKTAAEKGMVLESTSENAGHIILSNDNTLYPVKTEILLRTGEKNNE